MLLRTTQATPDSVDITIVAELDPGVSADLIARTVLDSSLTLSGRSYAPTSIKGTDTLLFRWDIAARYPADAESALEILTPMVLGLLAPVFEVPLTIQVEPTDTIVLAPAEDLVLAPAPLHEALSVIAWSLRLAPVAPSSDYSLVVSGSTQWPDEIRIDSGLLPDVPTSLTGDLRASMAVATDTVSNYDVTARLEISLVRIVVQR